MFVPTAKSKACLSIGLALLALFFAPDKGLAAARGSIARISPFRLPVSERPPRARFGIRTASGTMTVYRGTVKTIVGNLPGPIEIAYDSDSKRLIVVESQIWGENLVLISLNGTTTVLDDLQNAGFTSIAYDPATKLIYAGVTLDGCRIDAIDPKTGTMTPIAGGTQCGTTDGQGAAAQLQAMSAIAVDPSGELLYVADGDRVRTVTTSGSVTTITAPGSIGGSCGFGGNAGQGMTFDTDDGDLYVADGCPDVIRRVVISTGQMTTLAGQCIVGTFGNCEALDRDGIGIRALFASPNGIAYDSVGHHLYVVDRTNNQVRVVATSAGVSTLAGSGHAEFRDGIGDQASFNNPSGITILPDGNAYVADQTNGMIRKVFANGPPPPPPPHGITMMDIPTLGATTWGITQAPDGSIWFSEQANTIGALVRIDPSGTSHVYSLPQGEYPLDLAADAAGDIWFDYAAGPPPFFSGFSMGVKRANGRLTLFTTQLDQIMNVAIGGDGNAWFVEPFVNALGTITSTGVITQYVAQSPTYVGEGPDGDLWTIGNNFIGRYSTNGTLVQGYDFALTSGTIGLGPGADMWFTQPQAVGFVRGNSVGIYELPPGPSRFGTWDPMGLAPAPDGSLWFTANSTGSICDITTKGLFTPIEVPAARTAPMRMIEARDGSIWFTDTGSDKIGRWF